MHVTNRTAWVCQILLADQDKGPVRHAPSVDGRLSGHHLGQRTAKVDGARPPGRLCSPGHATLDGKVHLERARAVTEPAVGPLNPLSKTVAEDVGGTRRRHVKQ